MMMGMMGGSRLIGMTGMGRDAAIRDVDIEKSIDSLIEDAVIDLSKQAVTLESIAVWPLQSHSEKLNADMIGQKLIVKLVSLNSYKIISRQRLDQLLDEHELSISGAVEKKSAMELGELIGVEGFIDGHATIENNRIQLSMSLIETKSGQILWAKTVEKKVTSK